MAQNFCYSRAQTIIVQVFFQIKPDHHGLPAVRDDWVLSLGGLGRTSPHAFDLSPVPPRSLNVPRGTIQPRSAFPPSLSCTLPDWSSGRGINGGDPLAGGSRLCRESHLYHSPPNNALWWWHGVLFPMPPATWRTRDNKGSALGFAFDLGGLGRPSPQVLLASKKSAQKSASAHHFPQQGARGAFDRATAA